LAQKKRNKLALFVRSLQHCAFSLPLLPMVLHSGLDFLTDRTAPFRHVVKDDETE
jgi:hypothetical protein